MAISKRTRFEVFKRDDFACRYCGRRPPHAELHVDHIVPRSLGGSDCLDNLATACSSCNLGKSNIPLRASAFDREDPADFADTWTCGTCGGEIVDGLGFMTIYNDNPDLATVGSYPRDPHCVAIAVTHVGACDPFADASGYWIDLPRISSYRQMLEWCDHLSMKSWGDNIRGLLWKAWEDHHPTTRERVGKLIRVL